jgi:Uma2 family endonuclease
MARVGTSLVSYADLRRTPEVRFGVREYWIVDPVEPTIEILVLDGFEYRLAAIAYRSEDAVSPSINGPRVAGSRVFDLD